MKITNMIYSQFHIECKIIRKKISVGVFSEEQSVIISSISMSCLSITAVGDIQNEVWKHIRSCVNEG
jgi:hypothetical protein